jgi:hypothetical protein
MGAAASVEAAESYNVEACKALLGDAFSQEKWDAAAKDGVVTGEEMKTAIAEEVLPSTLVCKMLISMLQDTYAVDDQNIKQDDGSDASQTSPVKLDKTGLDLDKNFMGGDAKKLLEMLRELQQKNGELQLELDRLNPEASSDEAQMPTPVSAGPGGDVGRALEDERVEAAAVAAPEPAQEAAPEPAQEAAPEPAQEAAPEVADATEPARCYIAADLWYKAPKAAAGEEKQEEKEEKQQEEKKEAGAAAEEEEEEDDDDDEATRRRRLTERFDWVAEVPVSERR